MATSTNWLANIWPSCSLPCAQLDGLIHIAYQQVPSVYGPPWSVCRSMLDATGQAGTWWPSHAIKGQCWSLSHVYMTSIDVALNSCNWRAPGTQLNYDSWGRNQESVEIDSSQFKNSGEMSHETQHCSFHYLLLWKGCCHYPTINAKYIQLLEQTQRRVSKSSGYPLTAEIGNKNDQSDIVFRSKFCCCFYPMVPCQVSENGWGFFEAFRPLANKTQIAVVWIYTQTYLELINLHLLITLISCWTILFIISEEIQNNMHLRHSVFPYCFDLASPG